MKSAWSPVYPIFALAFGHALSQGHSGATDMGPGALMWPADRPWTADQDNVAPCGSPSGVGNRTNFPITGGKIALIYQADTWNVQVGVAYSNDPKTDGDFEVVVPAERQADEDPGHSCIDLPNPPSRITDGTNATIQIKYLAVSELRANQTFYACADITYVNSARFSEHIPCFNASTGPPHSPSSTPSATPANGSSARLSAGGIAGAVIGSVAGVALIGAALFFFRRRQKKERALAQQEQRSRGVNWEDQFPERQGRGSSHASDPSIKLQTVAK